MSEFLIKQWLESADNIVWVTGGTGLVGNAIQRVLLKLGYVADNTSTLTYKHATYKSIWYFTGRDVDLSIWDEVNDAIDEFAGAFPSKLCVIHLAAAVGGLYKNINDNYGMYKKNMTINFNLLEACHQAGVQTVISCLSTCIFPDKSTGNVTLLQEDMLHQGEPHDSNFGYAYSKRMLEVQSRTINKSSTNENPRNYICVIPTNIYGRDDNFDLEDGHVIPALIHQCYLAKRDNKPFVIRGTGKALRQFIYVDDLALLMVSLLGTGKLEWLPINRGTCLQTEPNCKNLMILSPDQKDEVTIKQVAEMICDAFDYHNLRYDAHYSDGQYRKTTDNSYMRRIFPEIQFRSLRDGIKETVDWFNSRYPNVRQQS